MTRKLFLIAVAATVGFAATVLFAQRRSRSSAMDTLPVPGTEAERRILSVIKQAHESGEVYLQVDMSSGRMLRLLTESVGAQSVVEVGTSTGYSGLWLCLALANTRGKLMTFELDAGRASTARKHFRQAGVDDRVTLVEGDAHQNIGRITGPIDVVFLDADKEGYVDYLKKLLPLLRPGGLIIADNIEMAPEYEKRITTSPHLDTIFAGRMSITLKKRAPDTLQTSAASSR